MSPQSAKFRRALSNILPTTLLTYARRKKKKEKKKHESNIYVLPASINGITIPIGARKIWALVKGK